MAYAEGTGVPVERTRAEIEKLLSVHGCAKFMAGVDNVAHRAVVQFEAHNRYIKFEIDLPNPSDPKWKKIKNRYMQRSADGVRQVVAQAERTKWRALLLVIKAKLEAVESGIATFEEEFLSHVLLPNQRTVAEVIGPQVDEVYRTGRMAALRMLEAPTATVIDAE